MRESDIVFENDIIREIAQERGWEYEEVEEIIKLNIAFLRQRLKNPEVTDVKIGRSFGFLSANAYLQQREGHITDAYIKSGIKDDKLREETIEHNRVVKERYKKIYDFNATVPYYKTVYKRLPFIYLLKKNLTKHLDLETPLKNIYNNRGKVWDEIAKFQNKIADEYAEKYE